MKVDPALERVRDVRRAISAACEHDPQKLVAYYLKRQKERQERQRREAEPKQRA